MALEVGTNTYASEAHALAYTTLMGLEELTDTEALLKRATRALDAYSSRFVGEQSDSAQPLEWPRTTHDGIPSKIADATVELALMLQNSVNVFAQQAPFVTSESVEVDVISTSKTYAAPHREDTLYRISMLLNKYLTSSSSVRLVRG